VVQCQRGGLLARERPGQRACRSNPPVGSAPTAERLADEEADQAAHDEHDGQEAER
jgi:hypothetical protein